VVLSKKDTETPPLDIVVVVVGVNGEAKLPLSNGLCQVSGQWESSTAHVVGIDSHILQATKDLGIEGC